MSDAHVGGGRPRVAPLFVLTTLAIVLIRGRAFFTPYSDPTIGLYLYIGNEWLRGHLPYVTAWDYRPPGFFALYAVAIAAFGSGLARDALATIALVATAFAVREIAARVAPSKSNDVGLWALAFFVMLSPVDDAIAGVSELQINACVAWSIAFALRDRSVVTSIISGLLVGVAIQCKLSAVPLAIIPLFFVATSGGIKSVYNFLPASVTPTVLLTMIYALGNKLAILYDANVAATFRRTHEAFGTTEFARNLVWFPKQLWVLAPEIELSALAVYKAGLACRWLCGTWFVLALLSIIAAGEFYERQFFLLVPPVAVAAGIGLDVLVEAVRSSDLKRISVAIALLASFAIHDYHEAVLTVSYVVHRVVERNSAWRRDESDDIYACLHKRTTHGSTLFLLDQNPFLYTRLATSSPTRFPYSDHLLDPRLSYMAGIDGNAVIRDVFARRPQFVATSMLHDYRYDLERVRLVRKLLLGYRVICNGANYRVYELR